MEVVATAPNGGGASPFHNHDVREWSRIDSLTGVLERARRETDHWAANTNNSSHKYGKVVDCRARSGVDGNLQQEARRQLEVFQSQIPGSRLQVIKTHSVSSSRWTKKAGQEAHQELSIQGLEDLQFPVNPLDVSIQKSKASLGRSIARRALSKQTNVRNESTTQTNDDVSVTSLRRVSRLCHQIHDDAVKQYFQRTPVRERRSANENGVEINETHIETKRHELSNSTRTGSTSSEDSNSPAQHPNTSNEHEKSTKIAKDLEDLEKLRTWRRTLKLRRSLQLPKETKAPTKPADLPENSGSVRRIREDIEKGRRLNTALRGNNVDFEALDQILQSISGPSHMDPDRDSVTSEDKEDTDDSNRKQKRNSFVTVESIKQVRNRLRRTSSPSAYLYKDKEESDDGIVTEDSKTTSKEPNGAAGSNRVRSYVYGMENTMSKLNLNGTGSLESRSKHLSSNFGNKNEDWYNRRKSYGFERMHNQGEDAISKVKTTESSTDSGICHSSEIVMNTIQEIKVKSSDYDDNNYDWKNSRNNKDFNGTTITIPITNSPAVNDNGFFRLDQTDEKENMKRHSIAVDESQYVTRNSEPKFRRTSLTNDSYEDDFSQSRKQKKVGFCKTEVHFTAESGRVNIVETDEKPPPTNNFRRRRRNTGLILDEFRSNGLPVFKFGDDLFNDDTTDQDNEICRGLVTVTSNTNRPHHDNEDEAKENGDSEIPKGILKNKPIKPRPYLLGIDTVLNDSQNFHEDIKLKSTREQPTIWRSTVTVRNTSYAQNTNGDTFQEVEEEEEEVPEFRKLLRNLKPVSKLYDSSSPNGIRIVSPNVDARSSHQWPVTNAAGERRRQNDDFKLAESKGYSTKINFGSGQATVIENTNARQNGRHPTWPRREDTSNDLDSMQNIANTNPKRPQRQQSKIENRNNSENAHRKDSKERSPLVMRKAFSSKTASEDTGFDAKKLSSPALVGQSTLNKRCDTKIEVGKPSPERSITKKGSLERQKPPQRFRNKSPSKEVLRQPKKSEMGYFGVPVSPKTRKNDIVISESLEKPDLLQFTANKKESSKPKEPIYENVVSLRKKKSMTSNNAKREFSSDILEELTKAADEILQAVNEHTVDDIQNKFNTDDEAKPKGKSLDTISETTSWKQTNKTSRTHTSASKSNSGGKIKVKHTPSNSSADSVSRERKSTSARMDQRNRHKTQTANGDNTAAKANAKARRLQRASSREALLQSRGSSSEDLPAVVEVPSRKHRLMKKTKSSQSTEQNSTTGKSVSRKKEGPSENKFESRVVTSNLPEIRHKTAVSTIRSTAEKSATREKSEKIKLGETKKRTSHHKQDTSGTVGAHKSDKSRETGKQRTPTSNGKKCRRYEASFK